MIITMRRHCLSLMLVVWGGWVCSANTASARAVATNTEASTFNDHQTWAQRDLAMYALYAIPTFAVTFTTTPTDELQTALDESTDLLSETGQQDSSLSYPIRSTTENFLLERFKLEVSDLAEKDGDSFPPIYEELIAVDLRTKIYLSYIVADDDQQEKNNIRTGASTQGGAANEKVTLVAEMYGTLAFLEPSDKSTKPSNEAVRELFGGWMTEIFRDHRDQYLRELVQSQQELLREISSLDITTNIDEIDPSKRSYKEGWSSRTEKALLTLLIVLSTMGLVWMFLYLRQRHRHKMLAQYDDGGIIDDDFSRPSMYNGAQSSISSAPYSDSYTGGSIPRPGALTSQDRGSSLDAARHGTDTFRRSSQAGAMAVLEDADRYLSRHRPDLYRSGSGSSFAEISMFGRNYSIPSNPFDMIYSSFGADQGQQKPAEELHSPRSAFSPRRSSLQLQQENIAMVPESLEEHYDDEEIGMSPHRPLGYADGGAGPVSSIWRHLSGMWEQPQPQQPMDQHQFFYPQQEQHLEQQPEEVPADYNFAFKDFPRHDGTPCLIYRDDEHQQMEEQKRRVFEIGDMNDDGLVDVAIDVNVEDVKPEDANTPVSDSAFQRMLSSHNLNVSNDDIVFDDNDGAVTADRSTAKTAKSPDFQEKLGRLMQQKQRHYEKKSIIEKHREQKAKERREIREKERRERHKAMESEIASIEADFKSPMERAKKMQMSPKVRRSYSPERDNIGGSSAAAAATLQSFSPKRSPMRSKQDTYRKAFSPYNTNGGIQASGSWAEGDGSSVSSRSSSKSSNLHLPPTNMLPPGGAEDTSSFSLRPRTTRPLPPSMSSGGGVGGQPDLRINTGYGQQSSSSLDSSAMDKLSMPPMTIDGTVTKKISPQSVMEWDVPIATSTSTPKKTNRQHRRVSSYDWEDDKQRWETSRIEEEEKRTYGYNTDDDNASVRSGSDVNRPPRAGAKHHRRIRSSSQSAGQSSRGHSQQPPQHKKRHEDNIGSSRQRRSQSAQRHRRSNTSESIEDVFLHGVFAQTRSFV